MSTTTDPDTAANDQIYTLAAAKVIRDGKCSTAAIQREFGIGYNRAARLVERMEMMGIVSPPDSAGKREVITTANLRGAIEIANITAPFRDPDKSAPVDAKGATSTGTPAATTQEQVEKSARKGRAPMKKDPDFSAHNEKVYGITADELRQFIERIEQLEAEKRDIAAQVKETYAEIKGRGFDTKAIRKIIVLRKKDPQERQEEQAQLDLYMAVLGME